jgi:hypothetical protein
MDINTESHVNRYVKCALLSSDFNQNWNASKTELPYIKFNKNLLSVVTCGQTDMEELLEPILQISFRMRQNIRKECSLEHAVYFAVI